MKIHSDRITYQDIANAVPASCHLAVFYHKGFGATRCGFEGSRTHERGFVIRLSGTSRFTMDTRNLRESEKSATWDEWGIFIAALFEIDPDAKIGVYANREDFLRSTCIEFNRVARFRPDLARHHKAPWLVKN